MSTPNTPNENSSVRVYDSTPSGTVDTAAPVAEQFIGEEKASAQRTLRNTQIGAIAVLALITISTGILTSTWRKQLEPHTAAQTATGLIQTQFEEQGPAIAASLKEQAPKLIAGIPDEAKKQIPMFRKNLETQIGNDMDKYFSSTNTELSKSFDDMIDAHKENIHAMIKNGNDPEATKQIGDALESQMTDYVQKTQIEGATLQSKLDDAYSSLAEIDKRMAKLAANKGLTPGEQQARKAISILSRSVDSTGIGGGTKAPSAPANGGSPSI